MNCPYCFEEIKNEAIKCKHCGEWLDGSNKINLHELTSNVISGAKTVGKSVVSIKDAIFGPSKYTMPNDSKPFTVESLSLYGSYLSYKNSKISYDDIISLYYSFSSSSLNFITTSRVDFKIFRKLQSNNYPLEDRSSNSLIHLHTVTNPLFPFFYANLKKTRIAHAILSEITFMKRLGFYVKQLVDLGYFHYPKGIKFYQDGKITKGSKTIDLNLAIKNDAIFEGDNRGFLLNRYSNSFKIEFYNEWKMFGTSISTNLYYDADVIKYLLANYKIHGRYITEGETWNYLDVAMDD